MLASCRCVAIAVLRVQPSGIDVTEASMFSSAILQNLHTATAAYFGFFASSRFSRFPVGGNFHYATSFHYDSSYIDSDSPKRSINFGDRFGTMT